MEDAGSMNENQTDPQMDAIAKEGGVGNDKESGLRRFCKKFILHPFGPFHRVWDPIVVIVLMYSLIEVPVTLAFEEDLSLEHAIGRLSLSSDLILCCDILILFRTAYFDEYDPLSLVRDWRSITSRYVTGWFGPDLLMSLPFEFILPGSTGVASEVLKMLRMLKFARMFKLLTLKSVNRTYLLGLKFVKVFMLMVLVTHLAGCCWFYIGYHSWTDDVDSWLNSWLPIDDKSDVDAMEIWEKYTYCWYWAVVTLFTTGYGDITATEGNMWECWAATIVILVGTCFVAYFIGNVSSLVMEGDRTDTFLRDRLDDATAFCDQKRLPRELTRAILTHIQYHCTNNYVFEEEALIQSLPPNIQSQIHQRLARSVLTQLDFFKSFQSSTGMRETLGEIALKMRSISCNEGSRLFSRGDRAKEIYIQRSGSCVSKHEDSDDMDKILRRGNVIGETALYSPKRSHSVTCTTFCEFYVLPIRDAVAVMQHEYPTTWNQRWQCIVHDLKVSQRVHGERHVRTVDFDALDSEGGSMDEVSSRDHERELAENMGDPLIGDDGANGQIVATDNVELPGTGDDAKKKKMPRIPFLGPRSSLSRHDDIMDEAKRRQAADTFVTHDLEEAEAGQLSLVERTHSTGARWTSDHIGDIVPDIDVDEEAVEVAARASIAMMAKGAPGHRDHPSVQVELSKMREVEDDLDHLLRQNDI